MSQLTVEQSNLLSFVAYAEGVDCDSFSEYNEESVLIDVIYLEDGIIVKKCDLNRAVQTMYHLTNDEDD